MGTTPQHIYAISISCVILLTLYFVFVSCVHSRVVEGSWEGIAGCVVCMESMYVVGECNVVAIEHGRHRSKTETYLIHRHK